MERLLSRLKNEDISKRIYVVGIDDFIFPKHVRYNESKEE